MSDPVGKNDVSEQDSSAANEAAVVHDADQPLDSSLPQQVELPFAMVDGQPYTQIPRPRSRHR